MGKWSRDASSCYTVGPTSPSLLWSGSSRLLQTEGPWVLLLIIAVAIKISTCSQNASLSPLSPVPAEAATSTQSPSSGLFTHPCPPLFPGWSLPAPSSAEALSGVLRQFQELPPVGSNGTLYPLLLWQWSHCCNYHFHDTFFSHIWMFTVPIPIMLRLLILLSSKRHIFFKSHLNVSKIGMFCSNVYI